MDRCYFFKKFSKKTAFLVGKTKKILSVSLMRQNKLLISLQKELSIHVEIEENILFSSLKECDQVVSIIFEAHEENMLVNSILFEMQPIFYCNQCWMMKLILLKENIWLRKEEKLLSASYLLNKLKIKDAEKTFKRQTNDTCYSNDNRFFA